MSPKDKRIDAYITAAEGFAKPILRHVRKLVHQACPEVEETIKWGFPHFDYQGMMCSMASFTHHCAFGFWKAKLMEDYDKKLYPLGETAMGNFGRITALKDLPSDVVLLKYIKEACRLNTLGIKIIKVKPTKRKALVVPAYFKKELAKNRKALTTFQEFSYTNKKDYVDWFTEAKSDETRNSRMATALKWLAEGKIRNWKYVR